MKVAYVLTKDFTFYKNPLCLLESLIFFLFKKGKNKYVKQEG